MQLLLLLLNALLEGLQAFVLLSIAVDAASGNGRSGHLHVGLALGSSDGEGEIALALLFDEAIAEGEAVGKRVACKFFDLRMLAEQLDGFSDDGLVELSLGVNRIAPESNANHSHASYCEIAETFQRPLHHLQHPSR